MSAASQAKSQEKVPSEDIIARKTDLCISNAIVKTGIGFGAGVVVSVLLFRRRAFPVWLGTGFGAGSAYTDCERSFNPYSAPGLRVLPPSISPSSSSPSSSSSFTTATSSSSSSGGDSTILERLSQRAGEALDSVQAKAKANPTLKEVRGELGNLKDQAEVKGKEIKELAEVKGKEVKDQVEKKIRLV